MHRLISIIFRFLFRYLPSIWQHYFALIKRNTPHEDDFTLFAELQGVKGLLLDVGANWGQSAISLFKVNDSLSILSMEPNTRLRWFLLLTLLRHPVRFRFIMSGAGNTQQTLMLNIPVSRDADLSPNATFEPDEFDKDYVRERLAHYSADNQGQYSFETRRAKVITVDSLNIAPLVIKMDVEGFELQALQGMEQTLETHHPLLMIELNNRQVIFPWLRERGYKCFRWQEDKKQLVAIDEHALCLNMFCIHSQSPHHIVSRLNFHADINLIDVK